MFSNVLEDYEKVEDHSFIKEEDEDDDNVEPKSSYDSSLARLSIFSRVSEISLLSSLSIKYQFFFLIFGFLMIFLVGFIIGVITANVFLGSSSVKGSGQNSVGLPFNKASVL